MKLRKKLVLILSSIFVVILLGIIIFVTSSHQVKTETIKLKYSGSSSMEQDRGSKGSGFSTMLNSSQLDGVATDSFDSGLFSSTEEIALDGATYNEESYVEDYDYSSDDSSMLQDKMLKKTYRYNTETTEFDKFTDSLIKRVSELNGYIEDESTDSREVNNSVFTETYRVRKSDYTIRIPADKASSLLELVDNSADVTFKKEYIEDVTADYLDTETYINSLKTEYEVLENLLSMATSVTELIEVQDRLTELNHEIESYESQFERLKIDIAYSKVVLTVEEVIYYEDEVERWTSDLAESWAGIFEEWVEYMLLPILLVTLSLIPAIGVVLGSIYLLMRAVVKFKKKNEQIIVIKQDKE